MEHESEGKIGCDIASLLRNLLVSGNNDEYQIVARDGVDR